jgi:hypothetical protein
MCVTWLQTLRAGFLHTTVSVHPQAARAAYPSQQPEAGIVGTVVHMAGLTGN